MWTLPSSSNTEPPSESQSGVASTSSADSDLDESIWHNERLLRSRLVAVSVLLMLTTAISLAIIEAVGKFVQDSSFGLETLVGMFLVSVLSLLGIAGAERFFGIFKK